MFSSANVACCAGVIGMSSHVVAPSMMFVQLPVVAVIPPTAHPFSSSLVPAQVVVVNNQLQLRQVLATNCIVQVYPLFQYFAVLAMVIAQFHHVVIHPQQAMSWGTNLQQQQVQEMQHAAHVAQLQALSTGVGQQWALHGGATAMSGESDMHMTPLGQRCYISSWHCWG
jgi:hypothetical protein